MAMCIFVYFPFDGVGQGWRRYSNNINYYWIIVIVMRLVLRNYERLSYRSKTNNNLMHGFHAEPSETPTKTVLFSPFSMSTQTASNSTPKVTLSPKTTNRNRKRMLTMNGIQSKRSWRSMKIFRKRWRITLIRMPASAYKLSGSTSHKISS